MIEFRYNVAISSMCLLLNTITWPNTPLLPCLNTDFSFDTSLALRLYIYIYIYIYYIYIYNNIIYIYNVLSRHLRHSDYFSSVFLNLSLTVPPPKKKKWKLKWNYHKKKTKTNKTRLIKEIKIGGSIFHFFS